MARVSGNETNNLWVLDLTLDLLDISVIASVTHFTKLQHINQRLVFWFGITSLSSCVTFLWICVCFLPLLSYSLSLCLHLSCSYSSQSESELFYDGSLLPISSSWRRAPWDSRPEFFPLNWTPAVSLSFTISAGPRQRIHFRVRVPWDSRLYFTVSDLRLPFSSPPTTCRATVEVFDLAPTWGTPLKSTSTPRKTVLRRLNR
jgi:hypothetical protein